MIKDSQKLQMVLDALKMTSNAFSIKLGYRSPGTIYHVLNGVNKLSDAMIDKIVSVFTEVNYNFLKNSEGEVLLSKEEQMNQMNLLNIRNPLLTHKEIEDPNFLLLQKLDHILYYQKKTADLLEAFLKTKKGDAD